MRALGSLRVVVAVIALLMVAAGILGRMAAPRERIDPRASSFVTSRDGVSGLTDALVALGIPVQRHRARLDAISNPGSSTRVLLAVIDPSVELSPVEVGDVLWHVGVAPALGDLLLAGVHGRNAARCLGYSISRMAEDSSAVAWPSGLPGAGVVYSRFGLRPGATGELLDSTRAMDLGVQRCEPPALSAVDTLLRAASGDIVALRLHVEETGASIYLVADSRILRNRALRDTPAGAWALGLIAGQYDQVIFDEYHHGFGPGGSLAAVLVDWSRRAPAGWGAWQLAVVGLLALLAAAVRFGPIVPLAARRRRSVQEHVGALATALESARGHDVAIARLVGGLRRRLSLQPRSPTPLEEQVRELEPLVHTERGRRALESLRALSRPGQPAIAVLQTANAAEDLWEELQR